MKQIATLALAATMVAGAGTMAQAASIYGSASLVEASGPYTWTYDAVLNSAIQNDVWGARLAPASWSGTVDGWNLGNDGDSQQSVALGSFGVQSVFDDELVGSWSAPVASAALWTDSGQLDSTAFVPEPATFALLGLGLLGAGIKARRRS